MSRRLTFPRTILQFQDRFSTEKRCWEYLVRVRWPGDDILCPTCGELAYTFISTVKRWKCHNDHQWSVTVGTIMERTHVSLRAWMWAAWLMTTQTPGVSAKVLERQLGVSYETAYMVLQRLRAATVDPLRDKLFGTIEVDETYVSAGRPRRTRWPVGRGTRKPLVVAAVEASGDGRIRLRRVDKANKWQLGGFIYDHVEEGSTVVTDGWGGYAGLGKTGYRHVVVEGETKEDIARQIPRVHEAFAELQTWLAGTHHGVSAKHLQAYLNEYAFRRDARFDPQAAFLRILQIGTRKEGPEYEGIYGAGDPSKWKHSNPRRKRQRKRA